MGPYVFTIKESVGLNEVGFLSPERVNAIPNVL